MSTQRQRRGTIKKNLDGGDYTVLLNVIAKIAPAASSEKIHLDASQEVHLAALNQLRSAISRFRFSYPLVAGNSRSRDLAGSAQQLRAFERAIQRALDVMQLMPSMAKIEISKLAEQTPSDLKRWKRAAVDARSALASTTDPAPAYLAFEVAKTLNEVLGAEVTLARDNERGEEETGKRGGAKYAQLLRATLVAAGGAPPDDLYDLMKQGKDMYDDPEIPQP